VPANDVILGIGEFKSKTQSLRLRQECLDAHTSGEEEDRWLVV
jgi:hypothetical protein